MYNQPWMLFLGAGFFVIMLVFLAAIGFLIYAAIEMRKVALAAKEFLKTTEERIIPLLDETTLTLRSVRKVSDDIGTVTGNVRELSGSVNDITTNLKALSGIVNDLEQGVSVRVLGVKAGMKAALDVLMKQFKQRRS